MYGCRPFFSAMEIVFHSAARGGEASAPPSFLSQVPLVRPLPADSLPCTAGAGFCAYGPAINRSKPTAQITALHPAQPSFSPALARPARSRGGRAPPPALSTSKHAARSEKKKHVRARTSSFHTRTHTSPPATSSPSNQTGLCAPPTRLHSYLCLDRPGWQCCSCSWRWPSRPRR
jgi:hypothetical protein